MPVSGLAGVADMKRKVDPVAVKQECKQDPALLAPRKRVKAEPRQKQEPSAQEKSIATG